MAHPRALSFSEAAALLSSGRDVTDALTSLATLGQSIDAEGMAAGNDAFLSAMCQASLGTDPRQALSAIGRPAQEASTPAEDVYLGLFGTLDGIAWPAGFRCTAIDTDTGELVVWDEGSGVPLLEAVASSCAVPMLFPIVTIKGRRYMDGGILSHLNATAAPPTDVLVVLSCHPLEPRGAGVASVLVASGAKANAELAQLRETRRDRSTDTFTAGQCVRKRIDFENTDLSPDGKYFIYYVNDGAWNRKNHVYRAISLTPWLKALAF